MEYDIELYKNKLESELVHICIESGIIITGGKNGAMLFSSPDIDGLWQALGPDYIADAMPQIKDYPTVSVAWAAYLGMAVACGWDHDWEFCSRLPYSSYYGRQGFDDMDDHIMKDVLGIELDSHEAESLRNILRRCAEASVSLIRHENIEPQSITAYHVFVATCETMYRIGAAIELHRLGYKFEAVDLV